jgi:hypothetical protein
MGLQGLTFLYKTPFTGEVITGMALMCIAYCLLNFQVKDPAKKGSRAQ